MSQLTVTALLERLAVIEGAGHGAAPVYAYLGPDGLRVQAEPAGDALVAEPGEHSLPILTAPIVVAQGAGAR